MMFARNRIPVRCLCLIACAVLILGACGKKEEAEPAPVVQPVKVLNVGGVESGNLIFPGTVDAGEKAALSFRVKGRLIELPIVEGQDVKKNQLIAQLDPRDYRIAVEEAQAQYQKAEADYRRYQTLYEKDAVPVADFDYKRSQRDVTKARLDEAKRDLGYTYLRAPFTGTIGSRYVENFMDVQPNEIIVDLNDLTNVEIRIDVPENIIKHVQEGMSADLSAMFESLPDKKYPLEVKEVGKRADSATQTFKVTLVMPQPKEISLLPGMTAQVEAVIKQKDASGNLESDVVVPAIAVVGEGDGKSYVWVVKEPEMTVHRKEVKLGEMVGTDNVHIRKGVMIGEKIVVAGMMKLHDGMQVRIWEEK
jgi:RND family efflux transporter MFP subunit